MTLLTVLQIAKLREQDEQLRGEIKRYIMITCSQGSWLVGMGTIPIPSIDTVDTCELAVSIGTSTRYR